MIRIVLRAAGVLASLASFMALLTARGPSGEPSILERIPALMDALDARVAAKDRPAVAPTLPPPDPRPAGTPPSGEEFALPPEVMPYPDWETLRPPRLPTGTPTVRVNRGLP